MTSGHEPNSIDISGIDRAKLLAALHNGTATLGLGRVHDRGDMTVEEAREILENVDGRFDFDYVRGRPIKVYVRPDEPDILCRIDLYDRDSRPGACANIVKGLR